MPKDKLGLAMYHIIHSLQACHSGSAISVTTHICGHNSSLIQSFALHCFPPAGDAAMRSLLTHTAAGRGQPALTLKF